MKSKQENKIKKRKNNHKSVLVLLLFEKRNERDDGRKYFKMEKWLNAEFLMLHSR